MNLQETLTQLVSIDSVSSRSNAEIANYLASRCERIGFALRRLPYTDEAGVEKINLVALAPGAFTTDTQVELALLGHTDTVPYDPDWHEALALSERDGNLYGRGSCDTKAFIAAMLNSVESLELKSLRRRLALVFTADEEVGLIGAKHLTESGAIKPHFSIVGEPTSLRPMRAGKGYCLAEIYVKGREAHSAYPAFGESAIFRAARLISRIEGIAKHLETTQHPAFDPDFTTLNVGLIQGGTAKNVIAGVCRLTLEWRPIPGQGANRLLELLTAAIDEEKKIDPDFTCDVDVTRTDEGFETPANSALVTLLETVTNQKSGTVAFGTEAGQMNELGAEAVVLGPGDIRVAHRTGEFVPIDQLQRSVEILTKAIQELCCQ